MSDEYVLAEAVKAQAESMRQNAAVKATEIQYHASRDAASIQHAQKTTRINCRINALNCATKAKQNYDVATILSDAEEMFAWLMKDESE